MRWVWDSVINTRTSTRQLKTPSLDRIGREARYPVGERAGVGGEAGGQGDEGGVGREIGATERQLNATKRYRKSTKI